MKNINKPTIFEACAVKLSKIGLLGFKIFYYTLVPYPKVYFVEKLWLHNIQYMQSFLLKLRTALLLLVNLNNKTITHLRTTTIGLSLSVRTIRPFHIISADDTIIAKFKN